jgi:hypothetical protein
LVVLVIDFENDAIIVAKTFIGALDASPGCSCWGQSALYSGSGSYFRRSNIPQIQFHKNAMTRRLLSQILSVNDITILKVDCEGCEVHLFFLVWNTPLIKRRPMSVRDALIKT